MNFLRFVFLLFVSVALIGCSSIGTASDGPLIQKALDATLPATFTGTAHLDHTNPYFSVTIDAGGLRRTAEGWSWDWLRYRRHGIVSHGSIQFGTPPQNVL